MWKFLLSTISASLNWGSWHVAVCWKSRGRGFEWENRPIIAVVLEQLTYVCGWAWYSINKALTDFFSERFDVISWAIWKIHWIWIKNSRWKSWNRSTLKDTMRKKLTWWNYHVSSIKRHVIISTSTDHKVKRKQLDPFTRRFYTKILLIFRHINGNGIQVFAMNILIIFSSVICIK